MSVRPGLLTTIFLAKNYHFDIPMRKLTVEEIKNKKNREKIIMLTCYDYSFARILDGKVDIILVGDSLGNVILGYDHTRHVTMSDISHHLRAVRRGAPNTFIVADLPANSYKTSREAITNAKILIESGADAVKPEGKPDIIKSIKKNNIEVMGHLGYLPQTAEKFKIVGRDEKEAINLKNECSEIEQTGAFCVVLECVPVNLAQEMSALVNIPTIGIGSGPSCDGQVLVLYDMLGLFTKFKPKFVRQYCHLSEEIRRAVENYSNDIRNNIFPSLEESYQ